LRSGRPDLDGTSSPPDNLRHTRASLPADSIMRHGFATTRQSTNVSRTSVVTNPGSGSGDVPTLDDELFDGVGLFGFDAEGQAFIAIDAPGDAGPIYVIPHSFDTTWPGNQYWGKAALWNQFTRLLIPLDDVIKLRLATFRDFDRKWLERERNYCVEFYARVRRVLETMA
jgi:hypothetical protein